jgi:putative drug exporter of the RND superfamily
VVRGILLPACLALLGERSWYLPRWLRWLPGRPVVPFGPTGPAAGTGLIPGTAGPAIRQG